MASLSIALVVSPWSCRMFSFISLDFCSSSRRTSTNTEKGDLPACPPRSSFVCFLLFCSFLLLPSLLPSASAYNHLGLVLNVLDAVLHGAAAAACSLWRSDEAAKLCVRGRARREPARNEHGCSERVDCDTACLIMIYWRGLLMTALNKSRTDNYDNRAHGGSATKSFYRLHLYSYQRN